VWNGKELGRTEVHKGSQRPRFDYHARVDFGAFANRPAPPPDAKLVFEVCCGWRPESRWFFGKGALTFQLCKVSGCPQRLLFLVHVLLLVHRCGITTAWATTTS